MNKDRLIVSEKILKYMGLQCNMDLSLYQNPPEIELVEKYFENANPKNVLELGCGLGRVSAAFYKAFPWTNTNFYLLDGDSGEKQIAGVNYSSTKSFYNSLKQTKEFCLENGIPTEQVHILNAEKPEVFSSIKNIKFDLVYSFKAIGFHWPISLYLNKLLPYLYVDSILCFGIRPASSIAFCEFNDFQINNIPRDLFDILEVVEKDSLNAKLILRKK